MSGFIKAASPPNLCANPRAASLWYRLAIRDPGDGCRQARTRAMTTKDLMGIITVIALVLILIDLLVGRAERKRQDDKGGDSHDSRR